MGPLLGSVFSFYIHCAFVLVPLEALVFSWFTIYKSKKFDWSNESDGMIIMNVCCVTISVFIFKALLTTKDIANLSFTAWLEKLSTYPWVLFHHFGFFLSCIYFILQVRLSTLRSHLILVSVFFHFSCQSQKPQWTCTLRSGWDEQTPRMCYVPTASSPCPTDWCCCPLSQQQPPYPHERRAHIWESEQAWLFQTDPASRRRPRNGDGRGGFR